MEDTKPHFVTYSDIEDYYKAIEEEAFPETPCKKKPEKALLNLNSMIQECQSLEQLLWIASMPSMAFHSDNPKDFLRLKKIKPELEQLANLIGMQTLKKQIICQILFFCQDLHTIGCKEATPGSLGMMHTVIQGSPGCGKTTVAKILAKIYVKLGILTSDVVVTPKRADLVSDVLGGTAIKAGKVLTSAVGGVLLIDEAYALGDDEQRDMFSNECINVINQFLTEHSHDTVVIIVGYQEQLQECFFAYNEGLSRRFPWVYTIEPYTARELQQICFQQVTDAGWSFEQPIDTVLPLTALPDDLFPYGGGDTAVLVQKCQLAHSQNTFGLDKAHKGRLTQQDVIKGLQLYTMYKQHNKRRQLHLMMYS